MEYTLRNTAKGHVSAEALTDFPSYTEKKEKQPTNRCECNDF